MSIRFLALSEVVLINRDQVIRFGGLLGIRDTGLLDSAVHAPQASFSGMYLHADIFEMAAVYANGLIKNHPFLDGNKRTGLISALLFLELNGIVLSMTQDQFFQLAVDIATSKVSVDYVAKWFKGLMIN